jgi:2-C-methyl-D-erythritol 4-phosphate cytidylyltransferase
MSFSHHQENSSSPQGLAVIIVAAGSSRRMGFDKLLASLAGKPVLQLSIEAFLNCNDVSEIVVVCPEDRFKALDIHYTGKTIRRIDGGVDRHDSVAAGLSLLNENHGIPPAYIAVHDGARPLICPSQISRVYHDAHLHRCSTSARPITETVKRVDSDAFVTEAVDRENLWLMETPQIFEAELLQQAYSAVLAQGTRVTDEVSALELTGHPTHLVSNPGPNPKITFPHDIVLAEKFV